MRRAPRRRGRSWRWRRSRPACSTLWPCGTTAASRTWPRPPLSPDRCVHCNSHADSPRPSDLPEAGGKLHTYTKQRTVLQGEGRSSNHLVKAAHETRDGPVMLQGMVSLEEQG